MTTLKRTLLAASLAGAGLLGAGGFAHADEADVSSIHGRASPPNPAIIAQRGIRTGDGVVRQAAASGTNTATIHDSRLDGRPLVEGRGGLRRDAYNYAPPVQSAPAYDVSQVLGRSSPPAPEGGNGFEPHS